MYRNEIPACRLMIDIPPQYGSTAMFRATLGHKINHRFPPGDNCRFSWLDSARFGPVGCLVTTKDVRRGEELFANYGYWVKTRGEDIHQPWYTRLYQDYVEQGNGGVEVELKDMEGVEYNYEW